MSALPPSRGQSWSYFNTPLSRFLFVFAPINLMMGLLWAVAPRGWMHWSAAAVVSCSLYALGRGYLGRLSADEEGVAYRTFMRRMHMSWSEVRRIDRYVLGVGGIGYLYVSRRCEPPAGRWDVGYDLFQVQDRPGLLETLREMKARSDSVGSRAMSG